MALWSKVVNITFLILLNTTCRVITDYFIDMEAVLLTG